MVKKGSFTRDEALTKSDVLRDITALKESGITEDSLLSLDRLGKAALSGVETKSWIRRFLFGFSLSTAIENWLTTFNPTIEKVIGERLPREETTDVVLAWMRFTRYRAMLAALVTILFSSLVTIVTAFALYQQIGRQDALITKQDEQIKIQINSERNKNIFLYLNTLYDEICEKQETDSSLICVPTNHSRQRSEALKNYIDLIGEGANISGAHLEGVNLPSFDFKKANLSKVNFSNANLKRANLSGSNLQEAIFSDTNLITTGFSGANLTNVDLSTSHIFATDFSRAYLAGVNFGKLNLGAMHIEDAYLEKAYLRETVAPCDQLKKTKYWSDAELPKHLICTESTKQNSK